MSAVTDSSTDPSTIRPPTLAPPMLVTVKQACQMLGLGRTSIHHLVVSGQLKPVRIGSAVRFSVDHLREFVAARSAQ
jgi:excisionase family DNA binding protein